RLQEAEQLLIDLRADCRKVFGPQAFDTLQTSALLGSIYLHTDHLAEAEAIYREIITIGRQTPGRKDPWVMAWISNLGHILSHEKKWAEAEPLLRESLALRREVMGVDHAENITSLNGLAVVLQNTNRPDEAEECWEESVRIADGKDSLALGHPYREKVLD